MEVTSHGFLCLQSMIVNDFQRSENSVGEGVCLLGGVGSLY